MLFYHVTSISSFFFFNDTATTEIYTFPYTTLFRSLRPAGRFAVSDVVVRGQLPSEVRRSIEAWVGCVAGALEEEEFKTLRSEEHTSELQSLAYLVCRLLLEKKKYINV